MQQNRQAEAKSIVRFCLALKQKPGTLPGNKIRVQQAQRHRDDDLVKLHVQEGSRLPEARASVRPTIQAKLTFLDAQLNDVQAMIKAYLEKRTKLRQPHEPLLTILGAGIGLVARSLAEIRRY